MREKILARVVIALVVAAPVLGMIALAGGVR